MTTVDNVIIESDLIFPGLNLKTKEEVISLLGEKLKEKGYVKEDFIEGVLKREEVFPTGLPFEIPVALPHTDAKYCNKTAFSIATLETPVKFKEMGNPEKELDVKMVILLVLNEPESQVKWLQRLIKILQNTAFLKRLLSCKNPDKIVELFQKELS